MTQGLFQEKQLSGSDLAPNMNPSLSPQIIGNNNCTRPTCSATRRKQNQTKNLPRIINRRLARHYGALASQKKRESFISSSHQVGNVSASNNTCRANKTRNIIFFCFQKKWKPKVTRVQHSWPTRRATKRTSSGCQAARLECISRSRAISGSQRQAHPNASRSVHFYFDFFFYFECRNSARQKFKCPPVSNDSWNRAIIDLQKENQNQSIHFFLSLIFCYGVIYV